MSKRFIDVWCSETGHIGFTDNGIDKEFTGSKFEDLLNELNEKYVDEYALRETLQQELQRVEEENERLKSLLQSERRELIEKNNDYRKELHNCLKENKQLKKDIDKYNKKIEIMGDAFLHAEDLIDAEEVFFTEVYEPSENFDEELLCEFSNLFFSDETE